MKSPFKILLYFFCFFPFLFPISALGTDIQFYAFITAGAYLLGNVSRWRASAEIKAFGIYAFLATITALLSTAGANIALRCWFQYMSLFVVSFAIYNVVVTTKGIDERLCKIFILCWFFIGFIQTFFAPGFLTSIVANSRTTWDRGVCGLASEPSFFGLQCFYFFLVARTFNRQRLLYSMLIISMALFFAQSFTGLVFLTITCVLSILDSVSMRSISPRKIFVALLIVVAAAYCIQYIFKTERLANLLELTMSNNVLEEDESSAVRMQSIEDAIQTSYNAAFLPTGFSERVGSLFGGILQEFGILGIPLICLISYIFASFFKRNIVRLIAFIIFGILFFTNMQLGNPTLSFVVAISIYYNQKRRDIRILSE